MHPPYQDKLFSLDLPLIPQYKGKKHSLLSNMFKDVKSKLP